MKNKIIYKEELCEKCFKSLSDTSMIGKTIIWKQNGKVYESKIHCRDKKNDNIIYIDVSDKEAKELGEFYKMRKSNFKDNCLLFDVYDSLGKGSFMEIIKKLF